MKKFTRHLKKNKKNKKNKTYKIGGATIPEMDNNRPERNGIIDYFGEKVEDGVSNVFTSMGDIGLKAVGLERVNKADEKEPQNNEESSGVISNIKKVADKTGAAIIENVNKVLGSDTAKENTQQAAQNTAQIVKRGAEIFNRAMNSPEVKEELKEAIDNAADIGSVAIEASKKPFQRAADVLAQTVPKAAASTISGLIKVGTDAMAAVPYAGTAIELGKMLNDSSKAVSGVVEATTDAIEAGSDLIIETKDNFTKSMKMLEEIKKNGSEIYDRTNKSIDEFENPLNKIKNPLNEIKNPLNEIKKSSVAQNAGGKSRKNNFNKSNKTKRVRFSI